MYLKYFWLHFTENVLKKAVVVSCLLKAELLSRAEGLVKETSDYRCLQSQFSVLYNESLILKAQLDETRARLNTTRTARLRQLEHMEVRVHLRRCWC